jgi:glycosyltransferase involved in cell wall biosynthesis
MHTDISAPLVSVVIPTRNRPHLVPRAVRSVLAQTYSSLEVIVAVDGPDRATVEALKAIRKTDRRLKVLPLKRTLGGSNARNFGIRMCRGEWIALLDDDDEWMANKLEKQLKLAIHSINTYPVISGMIIARTPRVDYVWPRTMPFSPIADYIMQRKGLFQGEGILHTSTLLAPAELFRQCPFSSGLKRHQDWDWLIRAFNLPGVGLEFVAEPLAIWHIDESRPRISSESDWRSSLLWSYGIRKYLSKESYASMLLTVVSASASRQGHWDAFFLLLRLAFKYGRPRTRHLLLFMGMWLIPQFARRGLRRAFTGHFRPACG